MAWRRARRIGLDPPFACAEPISQKRTEHEAIALRLLSRRAARGCRATPRAARPATPAPRARSSAPAPSRRRSSRTACRGAAAGPRPRITAAGLTAPAGASILGVASPAGPAPARAASAAMCVVARYARHDARSTRARLDMNRPCGTFAVDDAHRTGVSDPRVSGHRRDGGWASPDPLRAGTSTWAPPRGSSERSLTRSHDQRPRIGSKVIALVEERRGSSRRIWPCNNAGAHQHLGACCRLSGGHTGTRPRATGWGPAPADCVAVGAARSPRRWSFDRRIASP